MADSPQSYSLLRSKTFWTTVGSVLFNVVRNTIPEVQGMFPPGAADAINSLLAFIGMYFHLQTGQSTTGTN